MGLAGVILAILLLLTGCTDSTISSLGTENVPSNIQPESLDSLEDEIMDNRTQIRTLGDGKGVVPHPKRGFVAVPPGTIIPPVIKQICTSFVMDAHQFPDDRASIEIIFTYFDQNGGKIIATDVKGKLTVSISQKELLWNRSSIRPPPEIQVFKKELVVSDGSAELVARLVLDGNTLIQQVVLPNSLLKVK